jgi:hypothetical protein
LILSFLPSGCEPVRQDDAGQEALLKSRQEQMAKLGVASMRTFALGPQGDTLGPVSETAFRPDGQPARSEVRRGPGLLRRTDYRYDSLGKLVEEEELDSAGSRLRLLRCHYTAQGLLASKRMEQPNWVREFAFSYDSAGRLASCAERAFAPESPEQPLEAVETRYAYRQDQCVSESYYALGPEGEPALLAEKRFFYDPRGRKTGEQYAEGPDMELVEERRWKYNQQGLPKFMEVHLPTPEGGLALSHQESYSYYPNGLLREALTGSGRDQLLRRQCHEIRYREKP